MTLYVLKRRPLLVRIWRRYKVYREFVNPLSALWAAITVSR